MGGDKPGHPSVLPWPVPHFNVEMVQSLSGEGEKLSCLSVCMWTSLQPSTLSPAPSSLPCSGSTWMSTTTSATSSMTTSLFSPPSFPGWTVPSLTPGLGPLQDYFDIVKNPIDLSTIKRKLDTGQYQEPWQYVDDIWLMFNNAWLYNRKTSRVYKYCSKLAEVFEAEIDPVMQGLGYCCGRKVSGCV